MLKSRLFSGLIFALFALLLATALGQKIPVSRADTSVSASDIQDSMSSLQKKITQYQNELNALLSSSQQNLTAISNLRKLIAQTQAAINDKQSQINELQKRIDFNKTILEEYIRQAYYISQENPVINLAIENGTIANFDQLLSVKGKIVSTMEDIKVANAELEKAKQDLLAQQQQTQKTLSVKNSQQAQIASNIQDTQDSLANVQKKFAQLQSDLNSLLGTNYSASDIKDAVNFASDHTGVPRGFLVGVLKVETNLGANVGTGHYKTDMNPNQWDIFKSICKALGINPDKQVVSRRVCYNKKAKDGCGGWGGAMGVAQFIPTTWQAYAGSTASVTGHSPANPWSLIDGVTAMALKLKKTPGVTSGSRSAFKSAACSYLGACNTSYINSVLYWADNYKTLLN